MIKKVLLTGATKGIGLAISRLLAESGYFVIGLARNKQSDFPGELYCCDLSDIEKTAEILSFINTKHPEINYIVNNVGIASPQPFGEVDLATFQRVYDLNVRVALQVTQAFARNMKLAKFGRIVNIGSLAMFGLKDRSSYSAAKAALVGLTRTVALELAPFGITVNVIAPGPIETELFRKTRPIGSVAEREALARIPLGRIGKPEEIAATVKFLLSEDAGFITGQTLCVDGGDSI